MIKPGNTVVDIGAGAGDFTQYFLQQVGALGLVVAIETRPEVFAQLKLRFKNKPNVLVANALPLGVSESPSWQNLWCGCQLPCDKPTERRIDFVRINVPGVELKIIERLKDLMPYIHIIVIDNYIPGPPLPELISSVYGMTCSILPTGQLLCSR
jgi:SAM-dependent methyltransferase